MTHKAEGSEDDLNEKDLIDINVEAVEKPSGNLVADSGNQNSDYLAYRKSISTINKLFDRQIAFLNH